MEIQILATATTLDHLLIGAGIAGVILIPITLWIRHSFKAAKKSVDNLSSISSEKLKSDIIINSIADGVILIDKQKNIRLFNPAAEAITGWSANDAMGLDYHNVIKLENEKAEPYSDSQSPFTQVYQTATSATDSSATLVTHSGNKIFVHISVSPLLTDDKEVVGAVGIFRDTSKEKGEMQRRAEFISTASHEMRTPVAAIEGYLALALNPSVSHVDTKARSFLEKAHESTQRLGKLFQDLLTSAKAEDGRLSNHPVAVEMGALSEQLTENLRFSAEKKSLNVEFVIGSGNDTIDATKPNAKVVRPLYWALVDPDRIREVLTNIFDNAVKYTEDGKITVGITGDDNVIQLRIQDSGAGIPSEDVAHLFEKFYRVDSSAIRTVGGTGLGLFICRKIVELYSGRIWVDSAVGKGSTFYINIPRLSTQKAQQLISTQKLTSPLGND